MTDPVFVFCSNLAGRHRKGAALFARQNRGAFYGQSVGRQGNSYAIPTKDENLRTLPLREIRGYVNAFVSYACRNPKERFQLTPIGCGLDGYEPKDIAPMFAHVPSNVIMPKEFTEVLSA